MRASEQALIIIDMQKDLVDPESPVRIFGAKSTVPTLVRLLEHARKNGWPVFHVTRAYRSSSVDVELPRVAGFEERPYLVPGTEGVEIIDELTPDPGEYQIVKKRFSAFMQTELDLLLRRHGVRRLVVSGTQYPNCVRATCYDAISLDYEVSVVTDATSAATPEVAEANIFDLRNVGVKCIQLAQLVAGD